MIIFFAGFTFVFGQQALDELINKYNTHSVPYISVEELRMDQKNYLILDTRAKKEYTVSHIPGAIWASEKPKKPLIDSLISENKKPIVVYCSVGIRSEDFGERLEKMGILKVKNLYGSIFAWKNAGFPVVDMHGKQTDKVHTFNKLWSKYLKKGEAVY